MRACYQSLLLSVLAQSKILTIKQVPGSTTYSLALYYMMNTPVEDAPLLESFIKGDDAYRNSRFKLIPYISKVGKSSDCCDSVGLEEKAC